MPGLKIFWLFLIICFYSPHFAVSQETTTEITLTDELETNTPFFEETETLKYQNNTAKIRDIDEAAQSKKENEEFPIQEEIEEETISFKNVNNVDLKESTTIFDEIEERLLENEDEELKPILPEEEIAEYRSLFVVTTESSEMKLSETTPFIQDISSIFGSDLSSEVTSEDFPDITSAEDITSIFTSDSMDSTFSDITPTTNLVETSSHSAEEATKAYIYNEIYSTDIFLGTNNYITTEATSMEDKFNGTKESMQAPDSTETISNVTQKSLFDIGEVTEEALSPITLEINANGFLDHLTVSHSLSPEEEAEFLNANNNISTIDAAPIDIPYTTSSDTDILSTTPETITDDDESLFGENFSTIVDTVTSKFADQTIASKSETLVEIDFSAVDSNELEQNYTLENRTVLLEEMQTTSETLETSLEISTVGFEVTEIHRIVPNKQENKSFSLEIPIVTEFELETTTDSNIKFDPTTVQTELGPSIEDMTVFEIPVETTTNLISETSAITENRIITEFVLETTTNPNIKFDPTTVQTELGPSIEDMTVFEIPVETTTNLISETSAITDNGIITEFVLATTSDSNIKFDPTTVQTEVVPSIEDMTVFEIPVEVTTNLISETPTITENDNIFDQKLVAISTDTTPIEALTEEVSATEINLVETEEKLLKTIKDITDMIKKEPFAEIFKEKMKAMSEKNNIESSSIERTTDAIDTTIFDMGENAIVTTDIILEATLQPTETVLLSKTTDTIDKEVTVVDNNDKARNILNENFAQNSSVAYTTNNSDSAFDAFTNATDNKIIFTSTERNEINYLSEKADADVKEIDLKDSIKGRGIDTNSLEEIITELQESFSPTFKSGEEFINKEIDNEKKLIIVTNNTISTIAGDNLNNDTTEFVNFGLESSNKSNENSLTVTYEIDTTEKQNNDALPMHVSNPTTLPSEKLIRNEILNNTESTTTPILTNENANHYSSSVLADVETGRKSKKLKFGEEVLEKEVENILELNTVSDVEKIESLSQQINSTEHPMFISESVEDKNNNEITNDEKTPVKHTKNISNEKEPESDIYSIGFMTTIRNFNVKDMVSGNNLVDGSEKEKKNVINSTDSNHESAKIVQNTLEIKSYTPIIEEVDVTTPLSSNAKRESKTSSTNSKIVSMVTQPSIKTTEQVFKSLNDWLSDDDEDEDYDETKNMQTDPVLLKAVHGVSNATNSQVHYFYGKILNEQGKLCMVANVTLQVEVNDTQIDVPKNAEISGNCDGFNNLVTVAWRATEESSKNNSIALNIKITGPLKYVSSIHINITDLTATSESNVLSVEKNGLNLWQNSDNETLMADREEIINFDHGVSLKISKMFVTTAEEPVVAEGAPAILQSHSNALMITIIFAVALLIIVLLIVAVVLYKKVRKNIYKLTVE